MRCDVLVIERVNLARQTLLAESVTEGLVDAAQPPERLLIAQQVERSGLLLQRGRNLDQQLATRAQPRQADLEITADGSDLRRRKQPLFEGGFAESAQQRTP